MTSRPEKKSLGSCHCSEFWFCTWAGAALRVASSPTVYTPVANAVRSRGPLKAEGVLSTHWTGRTQGSSLRRGLDIQVQLLSNC